jgi:threonine/homoserine/homoserine lactone efflux protein
VGSVLFIRDWVNVAAATFGLSAVIASSALAFGAIKYAGAAYLIWLGVTKILGRSGGSEAKVEPRRRGYARLFCDGFIVNLLNPKTALFFLAFLPQFVDVSRGHLAMQIAVLGLLLTGLGFATDGCYALAAATVGAWLKRSSGYREIERYVSGFLLMGLGLTAAVAGGRRE